MRGERNLVQSVAFSDHTKSFVEVVLDHVATIRRIWPPHKSSNASERRRDAGLWACHQWAEDIKHAEVDSYGEPAAFPGSAWSQVQKEAASMIVSKME